LLNLSSFRFYLHTAHHLGLEFLPPALELNNSHRQSLHDETLEINGRVQVDQSPQVPVPPLAPLARRAVEDSCGATQMVHYTLGLRASTRANGLEGSKNMSVQFDVRLYGRQAGDILHSKRPVVLN
jgi:hypothetical protein